MSLCYWTIEGVGFNTKEIRPFLSKRKIINFFLKHLPDNEDVLAWKNRDLKDFDIDDFFWGQPFEHLADLLTHCDDTDTLCCGADGDGGDYFYYPPSMPWQLRENDPKSLEEVHKRIIDAVMVITDMNEKQIEDIIDDDLFYVGCG
jgi:hypothetical protein